MRRLALLAKADENLADLVQRHQSGDWGEVPLEDAMENDLSVLRIMSSYAVGTERIWIITEAYRSSTCILLPEDY